MEGKSVFRLLGILFLCWALLDFGLDKYGHVDLYRDWLGVALIMGAVIGGFGV